MKGFKKNKNNCSNIVHYIPYLVRWLIESAKIKRSSLESPLPNEEPATEIPTKRDYQDPRVEERRKSEKAEARLPITESKLSQEFKKLTQNE